MRCVCGLIGGRHSFTFDTLNVLSRRQNQREREKLRKRNTIFGVWVSQSNCSFEKTLSFDILLLLNIFSEFKKNGEEELLHKYDGLERERDGVKVLE